MLISAMAQQVGQFSTQAVEQHPFSTAMPRLIITKKLRGGDGVSQSVATIEGATYDLTVNAGVIGQTGSNISQHTSR